VGWGEGTLTRAYELQALSDWLTSKYSLEGNQVLVGAIGCHLSAAREAALGKKLDPQKRFRPFRGGPLIERARSNLDAAEAQLLNLAPAEYVLGQMPSLLRHVQRNLHPTDPGRQEFERIARSVGTIHPEKPSLTEDEQLDQTKKQLLTITNERGKIVPTVRAASSQALGTAVGCAAFAMSWCSRRFS
jgi:hypothetical protein